MGGKLSRKRLMRGDQSALTKGIHSPTHPAHQSGAKPHFLPPCTSQSTQKLPCTATAVFKTEKNFADWNGGCRAGKFGEMREVWREKDTLRKGVLLPPRSSRAPPRSSPAPPRSSPAPPRSSYPFLRIYLRTRATARRASGIRIAKTMIQTTKTVTETFRRADGRTCDSPIGYCRSSPASHERIAAV